MDLLSISDKDKITLFKDIENNNQDIIDAIYTLSENKLALTTSANTDITHYTLARSYYYNPDNLILVETNTIYYKLFDKDMNSNMM